MRRLANSLIGYPAAGEYSCGFITRLPPGTGVLVDALQTSIVYRAFPVISLVILGNHFPGKILWLL